VETLSALDRDGAEWLTDEDREWDYRNVGGSPAAGSGRFKDYFGGRGRCLVG
jgi:hypothetical protein